MASAALRTLRYAAGAAHPHHKRTSCAVQLPLEQISYWPGSAGSMRVAFSSTPLPSLTDGTTPEPDHGPWGGHEPRETPLFYLLTPRASETLDMHLLCGKHIEGYVGVCGMHAAAWQRLPFVDRARR